MVGVGNSALQVTLRPVTEADLRGLWEHQRDPEALRMAAFRSRDWEAFEAHWRKRVLGDAGAIARAVMVDGRLAGSALCFREEDRRLVGYWVDRAFWGRGVATRALALLLAEVDERPLNAWVAAANIGSVRVLEKGGFRALETVVGEGPDGEPLEELLFELE